MMQPPMPAITAFYAGLIALLLLVLAARVSTFRRRLKVSLGDGGDPIMQRAVRAHANAFEWALPVLLLMLLAELDRAGPVFLHLCGIVLIVARLLHAGGVLRVPGLSFGRTVGIGLNWAVLAVLAVWDVWAFLRLALT
jgi:uncharacterized membrane protein YecN with MAPEG domain